MIRRWPFRWRNEPPSASLRFEPVPPSSGSAFWQAAANNASKRQHEELFVSGEFADAAVAVVTGDTLVELVLGQEVEELGEDGATFVRQVKNRRLAVEHPRGVVAELKSKNDQTAKKGRFYRARIIVMETLTGQH